MKPQLSDTKKEKVIVEILNTSNLVCEAHDIKPTKEILALCTDMFVEGVKYMKKYTKYE